MLVLLISTLFFSQPLLQYYLTHPAYRPVFFFTSVFILACAFVAVVAGLSATLQNYRIHEAVRPAPSWLHPLLLVLCGVVIGMSLVGLLVAANPQASGASVTTTGEPAVHMNADNFEQNVVRVPKGSKLLLVNDTNVEHMLENGSWISSGTVVTTAEPGAPVLHNLDSKGGSSLEIGPFNTAGTFHIHCTIHTGMNLTIVVQ
jgi:plastocyanin